MSVLALEDHSPWTLDDWRELNASSGGSRYELLDGGLLVTPAPTFGHQWAGDRLCAILFSAAPPGFRVVTAVGVVLGGGRSALIPDLVVARRGPLPGGTIPVDQVALAVEIVSPSSKVADRRAKPGIYAAAGVPHYWRVELLPFADQGSDRLPVVFTYALDGDDYRLTHRVCGGSRAILTDPFPIEFDPAALVDD